jgi:hypothetical protein
MKPFHATSRRPLHHLLRVLTVLVIAVPALLAFTGPAQAYWAPTNGKVYFIKEFATMACLDVRNAGTTNGTPMQRWTCGPQWNQQFIFSEPGTPTGKWSWKIKPRYLTSKCLDAKDGLNATTLVQIWDCNDNWQQRWIVTPMDLSQAHYKLQPAYNLNYCLQVEGDWGSMYDGQLAYIKPCGATGTWDSYYQTFYS